MRVFTELYIDELRVLIADKNYEIDTYIYKAGDPEGFPDHGVVTALIQFDHHDNAFGQGNTPEEALEDLQSMVIFMYECAMEDLKHLDMLHPHTQEEALWWKNHWRFSKSFVPDEVADLDERPWERWEEWERRFNSEHIPHEISLWQKGDTDAS